MTMIIVKEYFFKKYIKIIIFILKSAYIQYHKKNILKLKNLKTIF